MKTSNNTKNLIKQVKYLLNSVHISFDLAKALKWRQLYRLLKKAQKLNDKLLMSNKDLKQFSKDIVSLNFDIKKTTSVTEVFDIEIKEEVRGEEKYSFIPFIKPFISFFQDEHPLLLI